LHFPLLLDGLYVCLSKYLGLCKNHLDEYAKGTGSKAFLNIKRQKVETDAVEEPEPKVIPAISVGCGFPPTSIHTPASRTSACK
jgi:hypothetical protein